MTRIATTVALLSVLVVATGWSSVARAQQTTAAGALPAGDWVAVAPARLDGLRGGYALPSGLVLSFGFQRSVTVNGALVSALHIDVPDIAHLTSRDAQALAQLRQGQLVQIGAGNVVQGDVAQGRGGLLIQNALDGQDIRATTTIDVRTNTLGLFQALNASDAAQRALLGSSGGP